MPDELKSPPPACPAPPQVPVLHGDELLHELRQGWTGLPNKTLLSLAMGGLRVRMMRSTVTMLSIVLAIAFLTYTGLSGTISFNLVKQAEKLGEQAMTSAGQSGRISDHAQRLIQADLLAKLDTDTLKAEAQQADLADVTADLDQQPILTRTLAKLQRDAKEKQANYQAAAQSNAILPAELNQARSQMETATQQAQAAQQQYDAMQQRIEAGHWIRSGLLPENVTDAQMEARVRDQLSQAYRTLIANIATPTRLDDRAMRLLDRPMTLASQAGLDQDVQPLRQAIEQIKAQRVSESLLNMLRRSGVNVEKTRTGNPMDLWLIVMALMTCAVGIANAMLMSVTERFREIGTMKCLGAQDSLVVKLFLLESAFLGVVGAAGGIVIGVVVSLLASVLQYGQYGLTYFPVLEAMPTLVWSVLGGVILSVAGAVYPAYAASRMKPVDALRVDE